MYSEKSGINYIFRIREERMRKEEGEKKRERGDKIKERM